MIEFNQPKARNVLIFILLVLTYPKITGQNIMPEVLNKNSLKEQLNYIEEKTRIYDNYRAIREDMFQKIKTNISDTLSSTTNKIMVLKNRTSKLNYTIDSLKNLYEITYKSLEDVTRTKNSIKVIGIEVNKITYNTIMWIITACLIAMLAIGFLLFKHNLSVTGNTKKELTDLKREFEAYRKTTREAREKMSMDHFNEIKRLKGG